MNIFVTGTESGIGHQVVSIALSQGHKVFATYLSEKKINELNSDSLFTYKLDLTDPLLIKNAILEAGIHLGTIDVLINVAGVSYFNYPFTTTDTEWVNTLNVNVSGYFFLTRGILPFLKKSQNPHIINISSIWGLKGSKDMYSYSVSKHAVQGLSEGLKEYCKPIGIKVSNLVLDKVDTDFREHMEKYISFNDEQKSRMLKPSNVAEIIMFLINTPKELLVSSITLDAFLWK